MGARALVTWILVLMARVAIGADGTLEAPASAAAGSTIEVKWNGDAAPNDFVSIDATGAAERTYGAYGYPARQNPVKLAVPNEPGAYVIRYHLADSYAVTASANLEVTAVTAELKAAESIAAGDDLEVAWTGPNYEGDFIALDAAGAPDRTYGKYVYAARGSPGRIPVLVPPGDYVLRYHLGGTYRVIGSIPVRVVDVVATLELPAQVDAGKDVTIRWTGPGKEGDFVSIDKPGAADRVYGAYVATSRGNPLTIRAPDEPGNYEVRYHQSESMRVIARAPLEVGGVEASITAPESVAAGARFEIAVSGPNDARDFVSVDTLDAPDRNYGSYAYTAKGPRLSLRAPDEPGAYQLRYHTGQTYKVLGVRPLTVTPVTASVASSATVVAGRIFEVTWEGPNYEDDFVTVVALGAKDTDVGLSNGYTKRGNPVRMEAPPTPGDYELRYLTGQSRRVLARAPVGVTPDAAPGTLRVVQRASSQAPPLPFGAIELVLDASGSMLQRIAGKRRIDLAKAAFVELTRDVLPPGTPFALRVFGHKEADSCRTDLEIPLAPLDRAAAVARIESLDAQNLAKTPIAASLAKVRADLAGAAPPLLVVLVTDGEETCEGDPAAAIAELRSAGIDASVNIVGFAIDDLVLRETFQDWARAGGGAFFDARDGAQLASAIRATLRTTYEAIAEDGTAVSGVVGGDPVSLPAGTYRVKVHGAAPREIGNATVTAGELHELAF